MIDNVSPTNADIWQKQLVQHNGLTYIPVPAIAAATGVRKRALLSCLQRNADAFTPHVRDVPLSTPGGLQVTRCLDRDGAMMLLFKLSTGHFKDPAIKHRLDAFRSWQVQKMGAGPALPALPAPEQSRDAVLEDIRFVKLLAEEIGTDPMPLYAHVLDRAGLGALGGLIVRQKAPVPKLTESFQFKEWLIPSDIAALAGLTPQQINQWLYNNGYQIKDERDGWHLTPLGFQYGQERVEEYDTGHVGIRIYWNRKILPKMNINGVV